MWELTAARINSLSLQENPWAINIQQLFLEPKWAIDSEAMRARGIIIQLAGQKYRDKQLWLAKHDSATIVLVFNASAFCYYWAITYSLVVAQPIRRQI